MIHRVTNQVTLIGHVAGDPTVLGDEIGVRFELAVTEVTLVDGETCQRIDWHTVVCWDSLVRCCQPLAKGELVAVAGLLRSQTWTEGGETRRLTEVHATNVQRLGAHLGVADGDPPSPTEPPAADALAAMGAKPTREQLLAALDREIAAGLEASELVIPDSRRRDHAWLKRNVRIDNRNARGQAVFRLAQELVKLDVRAAMRRAASETCR